MNSSKQSQKEYKRVVVKIGSSLLFGKSRDNSADSFYHPMEQLAFEVAQIRKQGKEVILVSSGAIASGMRLLKMDSRPKDMSSLQAVAAVGQHMLMYEYRRFFQKKGLQCGQMLLTRDDFANRKRYLNTKNALLALLGLGVVPIVNENDTVATEEIKFGDNDRLSAMVAVLSGADLLIILSDVDGLLDKNKSVIRVVEKINSRIKVLACPTDKKICVGGMITKLEAAEISVGSAIPCVIANGARKGIIASVIKEPYSFGTVFLPAKAGVPARGA